MCGVFKFEGWKGMHKWNKAGVDDLGGLMTHRSLWTAGGIIMAMRLLSLSSACKWVQ
jgi:hypothetical protein